MRKCHTLSIELSNIDINLNRTLINQSHGHHNGYILKTFPRALKKSVLFIKVIVMLIKVLKCAAINCLGLSAYKLCKCHDNKV